MCFPVFPQPTCPQDLTTSSVDTPTTITVVCSPNTADCPSLPWGKGWALSTVTVTSATLGAAAILVQVQLEGMGIKMLAPPSTSGPRYSVKHYCMWSGFPECCLGQSDGSTWKVRGINTSWSEPWTLINGYGQSLADSFASFLPSFKTIPRYSISHCLHPMWQTSYVTKQPVMYCCKVISALQHATLHLLFLLPCLTSLSLSSMMSLSCISQWNFSMQTLPQDVTSREHHYFIG